MFGLGKRHGEVERFNSLNPLCATIFHGWVNEFSKALSTKSSEQFFEDKKLRNQLDNIYALSRKGRNEPGVEKCIEDIVMHTASALQMAAAEHGQDEDADVRGTAASVPYIREIVFGFAPGLSSNGPSEAHEITVTILFILARVFANKTPKTFLFSVGRMCSIFGVSFDELSWSRLAESEWVDGYEVRQVEQNNSIEPIKTANQQFGTTTSEVRQVEQTKANVKVDDYFQQNNSIEKNDREVAHRYKLSADQGNAFGQCNLGRFYEEGRGGLPKDDREAARLYKLAADQGKALGQNNLGVFYEHGRGGLPKDDREAAHLYKLAADKKNALAQYNLGRFYEEGRGDLPKDDREAARLYKLAADQGDAKAQAALTRRS